MSDSFLKTLVNPPNENKSPQHHTIANGNDLNKTQQARKSIEEELLLEAKQSEENRKIPLMTHVDPDIYERISLISKKTSRSKSRVTNDILRKALMNK